MSKQKLNTKINTRLTTAIKATDGKIMYDASCKKILADKTILAFIMKECVAEYADITIKDIAERYIEGTPDVGVTDVFSGKTIQGLPTELLASSSGKIFFDIRYKAIAPKDDGYIELIINVEAQNDQYPGYPLLKRGIYYSCLMISSQYGTEFDKLNYNKLKKVYSIWLCRNAPESVANSIVAYEMNEKNIVGSVKEKKEHYDLLTVVMVHLGSAKEKEKNKQSSDMLNLFNRLFSQEIRAQEKLKILEEEYAISPSEELEREVVEMCNWSKTVEDTAGKRGFDRGHAEGVEEKAIEMAKKLLKRGLSPLEIAEDSGLRVEVVEKLQKN